MRESWHPKAKSATARWAGAFLILTALATAAAVFGRVAADADQPTFAQSMDVIASNSGLYGLGGAARLISGVALIAGAWLLMNTWIIRERLGTPLVPALLAASGLFTMVSGGGGGALAIYAPDPSLETIAQIRWLSGKIGFAAAGLALIVAARYQWKAGGGLKRVAPFSAIVGVAMQFIWIDAATLAHPIIGVAFFIWLLVVGAMLATGRVERRFEAMLSAESSGTG